MSNDYAQQAGTANPAGYGGERLYYYTQQGATAGPTTMATLAGLVSAGRLGRDDLVWADGDATSTAACDMPGLAPLFGGQPLGYQAPPRPAANFANFWQRFVAWVVDFIITFVLGIVVGFVIGVVVGAAMFATGPAGRNNTALGIQGLNIVIGAVIGWLYYALFESSPARATPGKMAMGLVVIDEQGRRVSFGKATGRFFGKYLSGFILGIGYLMIIWTPKRQALHDSLAGTLVVTK